MIEEGDEVEVVREGDSNWGKIGEVTGIDDGVYEVTFVADFAEDDPTIAYYDAEDLATSN